MGQEQAVLEKIIVQLIIIILVLQVIIELDQSIHKRVSCAFIDYRKTFDSINSYSLADFIILYYERVV